MAITSSDLFNFGRDKIALGCVASFGGGGSLGTCNFAYTLTYSSGPLNGSSVTVRPAMPSKTARRAEALARELFAEVTDTIREAVRIPQDRELAPENVQRACGYGLAEIFGVERSG